MNLDNIVIHCIGDSHVSVFNGADQISEGFPCTIDRLPIFRTYRIGPALAYNLYDENHIMRHKLFEILNMISKGNWVLLSFGEIDCRAHLLKQKEIQKKAIESLVMECVNRYFEVIKTIKSMGYNVIVWAIPATCNIEGSDNRNDVDYPHYGSYIERNYITKVFNDLLSKLCKENGMLFLSIFNKLVDDKGKTKDQEFYIDAVHLSQKAMPFIMKELERIMEPL